MVKVKGVIKAKIDGKFVDVPLVAGGGAGGGNEVEVNDTGIQPADDKTELWVDMNDETDVLEEAPEDGRIFGRKNGNWDDITVPVEAVADKTYNPSDFSGMARVNLPKNNGVLTQEMMPLKTGKNTIYIIQYDYTLNDQTITVPENCVLKFDGGSLNNGTIQFNETKTINPNFDNCIYRGFVIDSKIDDRNFKGVKSSVKLTCYTSESVVPFLLHSVANSHGELSLYNDYITESSSFKLQGYEGEGFCRIENNNGFIIYCHNEFFDTKKDHELQVSLLQLINCNNIYIYNIKYTGNPSMGSNVVDDDNGVYAIHTYGDCNNINILGAESNYISSVFKSGEWGYFETDIPGQIEYRNIGTTCLTNSKIEVLKANHTRYGIAIEVGSFLDLKVLNFEKVHRGIYLGGVRNSKIYVRGKDASTGTNCLITDSMIYDDINKRPVYIEPQNLNITSIDTGTTLKKEMQCISFQCYGDLHPQFKERKRGYEYKGIEISVASEIYIEDRDIFSASVSFAKHSNLNDVFIGEYKNVEGKFSRIYSTGPTKRPYSSTITFYNLKKDNGVIYPTPNGNDVMTFVNSYVPYIHSLDAVEKGTVKVVAINSTIGSGGSKVKEVININSSIENDNFYGLNNNFSYETLKSSYVLIDNPLNTYKSKNTLLVLTQDSPNPNIQKIRYSYYTKNTIYKSVILNTSNKQFVLRFTDDIKDKVLGIQGSSVYTIYPNQAFILYTIILNNDDYKFMFEAQYKYTVISSSNLPSSPDLGCRAFLSDKKIPIWWNGKYWSDSDNNIHNALKEGLTSERPSDIQDGFYYFDKTLDIPIWRRKASPSGWIKADGTDADAVAPASENTQV